MPAQINLDELDFSQNLNPFGPPFSSAQLEPVIEGLLTQYADPDANSLKEKISKFLGVNIAQLAVGAGSTELIFALPKLLDAKRAVIPLPAFWEYEVSNTRADVNVLTIHTPEEEDFTYNFDEIDALLKPDDALYISNVCNPTGAIFSKSALLRVIANNPLSQFIVDETYLLFRKDYKNESMVAEVSKYQNLHVILSFSKFFSMPGIRSGFLISNPQLVRKFNEKMFVPYSINKLAEYISGLAISNTDYANHTRDYLAKEKTRIVTILHRQFQSRLNVIEPFGNFILVKILSGQSDKDIAKKLCVLGIKIRLGSELPGLDKQWIRFSIREQKDNDLLLSALDDIIVTS